MSLGLGPRIPDSRVSGRAAAARTRRLVCGLGLGSGTAALGPGMVVLGCGSHPVRKWNAPFCTLASLADWGHLDRSVVRQAVEKYQIRDVQAAPAEERSDPSPAT